MMDRFSGSGNAVSPIASRRVTSHGIHSSASSMRRTSVSAILVAGKTSCICPAVLRHKQFAEDEPGEGGRELRRVPTGYERKWQRLEYCHMPAFVFCLRACGYTSRLVAWLLTPLSLVCWLYLSNETGWTVTSAISAIVPLTFTVLSAIWCRVWTQALDSECDCPTGNTGCCFYRIRAIREFCANPRPDEYAKLAALAATRGRSGVERLVNVFLILTATLIATFYAYCAAREARFEGRPDIIASYAGIFVVVSVLTANCFQLVFLFTRVCALMKADINIVAEIVVKEASVTGLARARSVAPTPRSSRHGPLTVRAFPRCCSCSTHRRKLRILSRSVSALRRRSKPWRTTAGMPAPWWHVCCCPHTLPQLALE